MRYSRVPFIEYYEKYGIHPVAQNISNIDLHYKKRRALLISLGITPSLIEDKNIIEFGPGWENSMYLAKLMPKSLDLVDGSNVAYLKTKSNLLEFKNVKVTLSRIEEFKSNKLYDIVWAEGVIPFNLNPSKLLSIISSFCKTEGILVISTQSGLSYLSEIFRRLIYHNFFEDKHDGIDITEECRNFYKSHTIYLNSMTRSIDDWIIDNIFQPVFGRDLFSIPNAISSLNSEFDFYNSTPDFKTDYRWYKDIPNDPKLFNDQILDKYYASNISLLDRRFVPKEQTVALGKRIECIGDAAWELACKSDISTGNNLNIFLELMEELLVLKINFNPDTALAIQEGIRLLRGKILLADLNEFPKWWGRGQQHVSFIRSRNSNQI